MKIIEFDGLIAPMYIVTYDAIHSAATYSSHIERAMQFADVDVADVIAAVSGNDSNFESGDPHGADPAP